MSDELSVEIREHRGVWTCLWESPVVPQIALVREAISDITKLALLGVL